MHEYGMGFRAAMHDIPYGYISDLQVAAKSRRIDHLAELASVYHSSEPQKLLDEMRAEQRRYAVDIMESEQHPADQLAKLGIHLEVRKSEDGK